MKQQIYNTAFYLRLSRDDGLQGESSSITTQRSMLRPYAKEPQLSIEETKWIIENIFFLTRRCAAMKNRWKRVVGIAIPLAIIIVGISYNSYIRVHTFTLSGNETVKSEQIQPVNGRVKVNGTVDTEVRFTDGETGKTYEIDYITSGVSETLQLERGKWYEVEGAGELIVRPVNIRIE